MVDKGNKVGSLTWKRSGALAGAFSTLLFTIIHDLTISDIWFAFVPMLVAGVLCGTCVSWSYAVLVGRVSLGSWLGFNLLYVTMMMLLGLLSILLFEPIMSMGALIDLNGPPHELIKQAMPMTIIFTLLASIAITLYFGGSWREYGVVLCTTFVLILFLGLNVSVLGLVSIPRGSLYLVAEFVGLIVLINLMYALAVVGLERRTMTSITTGPASKSPSPT